MVRDIVGSVRGFVSGVVIPEVMGVSPCGIDIWSSVVVEPVNISNKYLKYEEFDDCTHAEHGSTTQTSMHCDVDVPRSVGSDVWMVMSWAVALAVSRKAPATYRSCMVIADWPWATEAGLVYVVFGVRIRSMKVDGE